jgi:hypothetical protein
MFAVGWWYEILDSTLAVTGEGGFACDSDYMCGVIHDLSAAHEFVLVVGHGMENIMVLLGVSGYFRSHGYRGKNYFSVRSRVFADVRGHGRRVVFVDVRNWLHGDQCEFAEWAGWPLQRVLRWWPGEVAGNDYHKAVVAAICFGLKKYREWVVQNGLGDFNFSLSSMMFNHWSRQEESKVVRKAHTSIHEEVERLAHYGGFCRAHKVGVFKNGPFYLLDANGLYGWILSSHKLPYRHFTSAWSPEPSWLHYVEREGEALVCGRFEVQDGWLPVGTVPFVQWEHGPVDLWLPWPEVKWILSHGRVHAVYALIVYNVDYITRETVRPLVQRRVEAKARGDKYEATLWKLAVNSLYGKTAQRFGPVVVEDVEDSEDDSVEWILDADTGRSVRVVYWCGSRMCALENGGGASHYPKIAAWITSWARVYLWEWCLTAGWENVLYNDTDCLLVNQEGYERLKHVIAGDVPGKLKVECKADHVEIRGRKQYRIGDLTVDNTEPNYYYLDGPSGLYWIEKDALESRNVRGDNQVVLRRRYKYTWDSAERGWIPSGEGGE